jgi:hypothetical protein
MARIKICKDKSCKDAATTSGYCRLHYLKRWKDIKDAQRTKAAKRLNRYVERVLRENPDDYMEVIRRDLENEEFEESMVEALDFSEDAAVAMSEGEEETEIDRIIRKLKVEEGF